MLTDADQDFGSVADSASVFYDYGSVADSATATEDLGDLAKTLRPPLLASSVAFYAPTVSPGAVTLTPALVTNTQTFYGPTVASTYALTPALVTNTQTFYGPTVTATRALTPALFTNTQTFHAPTVGRGTVGLTPALFTNTQTFYGPTVAATYALTPARFDNAQTFYGPTVSGLYALTAPRIENTQTFYGPTALYLEYRYARPIADVSQGDWIPSTGPSLYAVLDEEPADDNDYITTGITTTCELRLAPVIDPQSSSGQVVRYRARSPFGNTLIARLKQGAATIASATHTNVSSSWTDYEMILSGAECDAITDYTDLRVELEAA